MFNWKSKLKFSYKRQMSRSSVFFCIGFVLILQSFLWMIVRSLRHEQRWHLIKCKFLMEALMHFSRIWGNCEECENIRKNVTNKLLASLAPFESNGKYLRKRKTCVYSYYLAFLFFVAVQKSSAQKMLILTTLRYCSFSQSVIAKALRYPLRNSSGISFAL